MEETMTKESKLMHTMPIICSVFLVLLLGWQPTIFAREEKSGIDIKEFIIAVKQELLIAEATSTGEPPLNLYQVDMELSVTEGKKADGSLALIVLPIDFKGDVSTEQTTSITMTWKTDLVFRESAKYTSFGLADIIKEIKKGLAEINKPAICILSLNYECNIVVTKETGGGIKFKLFTAEMKYSKAKVQKVTFRMKQDCSKQ